MRPIDADALLKLIKDTNDGYRYGYLDATDIHNAPTLTLDDLRPKGEWTKTPGRSIKSYLRRCSKCGKDAYFCGGEVCSYNFCPHCGAKMGGGE